MFEMLRRKQRPVVVQIKSAAHRPLILGPAAQCCDVCKTGGPFAWLAYRGEGDERRPVAWLCLYCFQLGHSPYAFAARARAQDPAVRFVAFPGTSIEAEQDLPAPAETVA